MSKILLIEDDEYIAQIERDFLEVNGFETVHESEGYIDKILELMIDVDLVVLDLMLPRGDGFEICKQLRRQFDVPIIIISAKSNDIDKVLGLGFGANDYLIKPFSLTELVARVKSHIKNYEMLKKTSSIAHEIISIRDLVINVTNKEVFSNNKEIKLTNKEYNILLLLAQNRGKVFSKEEIYEKVWKEDALGYYETVSVHIQKIRDKIENDAEKSSYIKTLWGIGYKMI